MKKNKLFSVFAVLATASIFVGCYNGTDLTKTWDKAGSYNDKAVENFSAPKTCEISVNSNSSDLQANKKENEVVIDFKSDFYLDESTLNAVSFFGITESENNYPTETALTSSVKEVTKSDSGSGVVTTVTYNVDLTSYNKNKIGAKVDATVLKDVNKNFVLNGNRNEKAGEATDSIYIGVLTVKPNKNDDAFTETLKVTLDNLKPFALIAPISATVTSTEAGLLVTVPTWDSDLAGTKNTASAGTLGSIYKIQTIAPGESKWTDNGLSFEYTELLDSYNALLTAPVPGTKYRLIETLDPAVTVKFLGLDAPMTYISTKFYSDSNYKTYSYYPANTTTIVTDTTMPALGTNASPETIQKGFAKPVERTALTLAGYGAKFEIEFDFSSLKTGTTKIGLSATDDFIVTTKGEYGYKKVPATVEAVKNDDGIITKVIVKTEESKKTNYLADDLLVWAGSGVTITRNDINAAQTHFGMPKDFAKKDASGYVQFKIKE